MAGSIYYCLDKMKHTFASISKQSTLPVYLDCNATAPLEPSVRETLIQWHIDEIGNAGSRTHVYGLRAKRAVEKARDQIASVVLATGSEVIFTSGATEANNLALIGLAKYGRHESRTHIVSTAIEHKAVLEPLEYLADNGFTVTLVNPESDGRVSANKIIDALRPNTLLVSVMHANNETGVIQPIQEIAARLEGHDTLFHVDAAQGYGKDLEGLRSGRIDLTSISSHKVYGPLGIGALVARRRGFKRPPIEPLMYGGGQERGIRPGTLPVPLIVAFGVAAELAIKNNVARKERCMEIRAEAMAALRPLGIQLHSELEHTLPHVVNFSVPGVDSEAIMVALKDVAAVSNGSACTSQRYTPSHVLKAMGLPKDAIEGAIRTSWSHMTPKIDWANIAQYISSLC